MKNPLPPMENPRIVGAATLGPGGLGAIGLGALVLGAIIMGAAGGCTTRTTVTTTSSPPASVNSGNPLDALMNVRDARSARTSSAHPEPWSNGDNRWVKPGETTTLGDFAGPGVVRHIWFTFPESAPSWISKAGCADPSELVLRMYWDGSTVPDVEAPLGDFFGCGFGMRAEVNSIPVQVQGGDSYNCFWPMPFHRSGRITLTNESERPLAALYFQIDWTQEPSLPADAAYFCAQYRQEFPCGDGHEYLIADIDAPGVPASDGSPAIPGGGHYVGTVMSVRSRSPQWFGEGDDLFYIDGEAKPSIRGTGTEDYFLNAWGMEKSSFPYFGVSRVDGWLADLGDTGTMYRWQIPDAICFRKSLIVKIEHAGWMSADETTTGKVEGFVDRNDDFSTVAFWYQRGHPKRFAEMPSAAARRLPQIDLIHEGETLLAGAKMTAGSASLQAGGPWTGKGQIFFQGEKAGSSLEVGFDVREKELRRLVLPLTRSYDYGIYDIYLDGAKVGEPVDCFSTEIKLVPVQLGDMTLETGRHTIKLVCVGRNEHSTGFKAGLDSVRLRERSKVKRPPLHP